MIILFACRLVVVLKLNPQNRLDYMSLCFVDRSFNVNITVTSKPQNLPNNTVADHQLVKLSVLFQDMNLEDTIQ